MIPFILENKIQFFSILGSVLLFLFILKLIKRRKLKEEYSLLWLGFSFGFLILSIFRPLLDLFASFVGIHYAPAAILLFLILAILCVLIQFSMVLSKLSEQNKNLVQEFGILKQQFESLKNQIK